MEGCIRDDTAVPLSSSFRPRRDPPLNPVDVNLWQHSTVDAHLLCLIGRFPSHHGPRYHASTLATPIKLDIAAGIAAHVTLQGCPYRRRYRDVVQGKIAPLGTIFVAYAAMALVEGFG